MAYYRYERVIEDLAVICEQLFPSDEGGANRERSLVAVTVRGMTLGDIRAGAGKALVAKEFFLGLANGGVTGVLCGVAMFFLARSQDSPHALFLGLAVFLAMMGACAVSGVSGALCPAGPQAARGRPDHGVEHHRDDGHGRGEHGAAAGTGHGTHPLNNPH